MRWPTGMLIALAALACAAPNSPAGGGDAAATMQAFAAAATAVTWTPQPWRLTATAETAARPVAPTATPAAGSSGAASATALRNYLAANFGTAGAKTSWYDLITEITVQDDTAVAHTSARPDPAGRQAASAICSAVSGFAYDRTNSALGLQSVQVYGQDGALLANRHAVSDRC